MDINVLKQLLKDNLKIKIEYDDIQYEGEILKVSLLLDGEEISNDYVITNPYTEY